MKRWLKDFVDLVDPLTTVAAGLLLGVLGLLGKVTVTQLSAAILGVLSLFAFTIVRDRLGRRSLSRRIEVLVKRIESPNPDEVFGTETDERGIIRAAHNEVWLIQETGNQITERARAEIAALLGKKGKVNLLVTMPSDGVATMMAFRNANLSKTAFMQRYVGLNAQLANIRQGLGSDRSGLKVRYLPYPIGMTCVIGDPESEATTAKQAIVRDAGFMIPYERKLDFYISGMTSPKTFHAYFVQVLSMWAQASKIILLTGKPRAGKTKAIQDLLSEVGTTDCIYYVVSKAEWENNQRTGFVVQTSRQQRAITFANRNADGRYTTDSSIWDSIALEIHDAVLSCKFIVIDEIGPLQLESAQFRKEILRLIDDPNTYAACTIALDNTAHPMLEQLKSHPRVTQYSLDIETGEFRKDFLASFRAIRILSGA